MKSIRLCNLLIHIYMFISVLGLILLLSVGPLGENLLTLGAKSWLIAIGLAGSDIVNGYIRVFLFLWGITFYILLLVFYIMACRKRQIPFVVITTIDSIIALAWTINCLITDNVYGFKSVWPNAVTSILYSAVLLISVCQKYKMQKAGDGSVF